MHVPSPIPPVHRWVAVLLCLPPLVGLALLMVPDHEIAGGMVMLSWPLPVVYLAIVRRRSAASLAAASMAATSLVGLGWTCLSWTRTGCMYGFVLMGAVTSSAAVPSLPR